MRFLFFLSLLVLLSFTAAQRELILPAECRTTEYQKCYDCCYKAFEAPYNCGKKCKELSG